MIDKLTQIFTDLLESERTSGMILIICTFLSIAVANSDFGGLYSALWHTRLGFEIGEGLSLKYSLSHWINDGLMAVFFLLIGLEIERELYVGELSSFKNALLPVIAAVGGMVVPTLLHFLLNMGTETRAGIGIPMATDIAFALGAMSLLGGRIPPSLMVFLTALAIIDDLGAIAIIALFYVNDFSIAYFSAAMGVFVYLLALNRLGVRRLPFYLIPGGIMWYFMLKSGIHATIAGVLLAFAVPFENGGNASPSHRLQHFLHKPVAFFIMPLFALANTGVELAGDWTHGLASDNSLGILAGLFIGKPVGIGLFSYLAVRAGLSDLPDRVRWKHILGVGFLGGIGFTMSIFITLLAFDHPELIRNSKISILIGSLAAGTVGYLILRMESSPIPPT